jgi:hypothetical protein
MHQGCVRSRPRRRGGERRVVADIAKLSVGREEFYTRELATDHETYLSGHGESPGPPGHPPVCGGRPRAAGRRGAGPARSGAARWLPAAGPGVNQERWAACNSPVICGYARKISNYCTVLGNIAGNLRAVEIWRNLQLRVASSNGRRSSEPLVLRPIQPDVLSKVEGCPLSRTIHRSLLRVPAQGRSC